MMKEQAAFEIIKLGLALAVFFGASIFYSRIKDRIVSGVDKEVFDYAVVSAKNYFFGFLALFIFYGVGTYLFGSDVI
jgi:hypothetical protein